jgi:Protein of unknown function (DUF3352)
VLIGVLLTAAATVLLLSRDGDEAPPDRAAEFVRGSALAYVHVSTDPAGDQLRRATQLVNELPTLELLRERFIGERVNGLSFERDVRPWLGKEAAFALVPLAEKDPAPLLVLQARDSRLADQTLLRRSAGAAVPYRGQKIYTVGRDAAALVDGFVLAGHSDTVRRAIDVHAGATGSLADHEPYTKLRDDLPERRLVHGWASRNLLESQLAGPAALLAGAARAEGIDGGAFSLGVDGERTVFAFRGNAARDSGRTTGCEGGAKGASLLSSGPKEPTALLGLDGLQCLVRGVLATPAASATGDSLRGILAEVEQRDKVDLQRELLPLLKGESEVVMSEGEDAPVISASVNDVDERKALDVLGRLQPALIRLVDPEGAGQAASFSSRQVGGRAALTASLSPALELTYAAFDDKLVASTSAKGVEEADKGEGPEESEDFKTVLGSRPDRPSALVFFDFDKLLALGDRVGLAEVPAYLAVRDDLQKLGALGAWVSREEEAIKAELSFRTP